MVKEYPKMLIPRFYKNEVFFLPAWHPAMGRCSLRATDPSPFRTCFSSGWCRNGSARPGGAGSAEG